MGGGVKERRKPEERLEEGGDLEKRRGSRGEVGQRQGTRKTGPGVGEGGAQGASAVEDLSLRPLQESGWGKQTGEGSKEAI